MRRFVRYVAMAHPEDPVEAVIQFAALTGTKASYRKNVVIHVLTALRRGGLDLTARHRVRRLLKLLDLQLLHEDPNKAPLLSQPQTTALLNCPPAAPGPAFVPWCSPEPSSRDALGKCSRSARSCPDPSSSVFAGRQAARCGDVRRCSPWHFIFLSFFAVRQAAR
eukprot:PhM_4_TR17372/c4_g2_i5/m.73080